MKVSKPNHRKDSRRILLGITGSIAAYKTPDLIRQLKEQNYEVKVVVTSAGKAFVAPLALQAVSCHPIYEHLMEPQSEAAMSHIELARWPDLILIAPTTAHFIAKLAHGFADDLLSTLCLASQTPILLAPAMNQAMWSNPATQANVYQLKDRGYALIGPAEGVQACGDEGLGRLVDPLEIIKHLATLETNYYLKNLNILITAGPTREYIDPVRYLSNCSSGKMGFALAQAAIEAGANVTLVHGPVTLEPPEKCKIIAITTAAEMLEAVHAEIAKKDVFISTAAVADYQPLEAFTQKLKKTNNYLTLNLKPTIDILSSISCKKLEKTLLVGFSAETTNILHFSEEKRLKKGLDLMVVNDVSIQDIGFDSDENSVTILSEEIPIHLEKAHKKEIAKQLLAIIEKHHAKKLLNVVLTQK